MKLNKSFVAELEAVHPRELIKQLQADDRPHFNTYWTIRNGIRPADLYCYLYARFGPPNGLQNFLRGDTSDNLIHWEWTLHSQGCIMLVQGQNFRTDIWLSGEQQPPESQGALISAFYIASAEDVILSKLQWYELSGAASERQWLDVLGVIKVQGDSLDRKYLSTWSVTLGLLGLLKRAFYDAGVQL